jgi:prepilin-type N-terminal cleavage/methylation domain-containing protein
MSMNRRASAAEQGFTLLELMIVVAIIAAIAVMSIPRVLEARKQASEAAAAGMLRSVYVAEMQYINTWGTFAGSLDQLAKTVEPAYFQAGVLGPQPAGDFLFTVLIPDKSTAVPAIADDQTNAQTRFRIAAQVMGPDAQTRIGGADYFMIMREDDTIYIGPYTSGWATSDAASVAATALDTDFGTTFPILPQGQ